MSPELRKILSEARSVVVLTGAGVSAESGIATFRDPDGLWQQFKPQELANIDAFLANPSLVQRWYAERRRVVEEAEPNPAHRALALLDTVVETTIITQNVDGLHHQSGSRNVIELHGNIRRSYCVDCGGKSDNPQLDAQGIAHCRRCSGLIRPDVVWFGEMLPVEAIRMAYEATRTADVFLSIGTGAEVSPAADLPIIAGRHGAYTVEMNIRRSAISDFVDEIVSGPAGTTVPDLVSVVLDSRQTST
ncbi:MAG: NAD-dependent deacylase [Rhodothermales bacterium]|nr:NAD-dependent deacylase [Rhodothermales bacterium]